MGQSTAPRKETTAVQCLVWQLQTRGDHNQLDGGGQRRRLATGGLVLNFSQLEGMGENFSGSSNSFATAEVSLTNCASSK